VSPDGRYLSFVDWGSGNIAVRELATGETRLVTGEGSMSAPRQFTEEGSVISPDGRSLCYDWFNSKTEPWRELRVTDLRGSEYRTVYRADVEVLSCEAWSPDGRHVVAAQAGQEGTPQLVLVSLADGSARTLKERTSGWFGKVSFSPDGRYIAYDRPSGADGGRDIFVFSLNGGCETALVEHPANDVILGWAPDGHHILFASDRTGTLGAWLMPVADGRPAGQARLVNPDMWRVWPLGFTRDGSFYYGVNMTARAVYVASLDPETGEMLAAPAAVSGDYYGDERLCDWSPYGRYLLFRSADARRDGGNAYSIRSVETGGTRQLVPDLDAFVYARWLPDGYSLIVPGLDREGRPGVYKVDVQTGDSEPLAPFDDPELFDWFGKLIGVSPDGRKVYYTGKAKGGAGIAEMDLESGSERLLGHRGGPGLDPWALSPDGEYVAFATEDGTLHRLMVVPTAGGEPRELHRYEAETSWVQSIAWSRDGKHLLYSVRGDPRLWRIGVDGGPPERTGLSGDGTPAHLSVHPDGRRIAFDLGSGGAEVWVMESFLPAVQTP